ncbi:GDP-L-fucose synthase [Candidatus Gastranaerophilus sp. (ex Termes propinquus)]|nr:GDP-L-fucose synthase [Candidatus Gastranaerophilus sp. (ex Termes propinquus)]
MNILLTGSGGFVGKNLKTYLEDKYALLTPRSFELDLTDKEAVSEYFSRHNIDLIIHCGTVGGARGAEDKDTTVQDNILMVENLAAVRNKSVRIILFGSGAMYCKSRHLEKINEGEIGKVTPKDLYGQSKMLIAQKVQTELKDALCLNIFACYGQSEHPTRFPTYAISQNINRKAIEINQNVVFDYLFVEDMQRIVHHFIENKSREKVLNITPKTSISLVQIAQIVNEINGFESEIIIKNPNLNNEYTGCNKRLLKEMPHLKFTDYKTGLKRLYSHLLRSQQDCC